MPTQKIAEGPARSTMTPAIAGPSAAPTPRLTDRLPIARMRAAGGNVSRMIP